MLSLFLIGFGGTALAQQDRTADSTYRSYVNRLGRAYWAKYSLEYFPKVIRNLFPEVNGKQVVYTAPKGKNPCEHITPNPSEVVFSQSYNITKTSAGYILDIAYIGCRGHIVFSEYVEVKGKSAPPNAGEIITGLRKFDLEDGDDTKTIGIYDSGGNALAETFIERLSNGQIVTLFFSKEVPLANVVYAPKSKSGKFMGRVQFQPYDVVWEHKLKNGGRSRINSTYGAETLISVEFHQESPQHYLIINGDVQLSSKTRTDEYLSHIENIQKYSNGTLVQDMLFEFPRVQNLGGDGKQRFKDDLNLFIIRLQSGSEANRKLVIVQIRNLLEAIEAGEFDYQDNRPHQ